MKKTLIPEQIYEVVMLLTGPVRPVADSAIDEERFYNLADLIRTADFINATILEVALDNSPYGSVQKLNKLAADWVKKWHDKFGDIYEEV